MNEEELAQLKLLNYRKWYYIKNREKIAEYQRRYYLRKKGLLNVQQLKCPLFSRDNSLHRST